MKFKVKKKYTVDLLSAKCKKDLLLIVDTSYSIGKSSFNKNVKPFLEQLVTDQVLNVGRDDTQMAMMIFSQKQRTKILLNFGDMYDKNDLTKYISNLKWKEVSGDRTRTDLALKIANDEVGCDVMEIVQEYTVERCHKALK